MHKLENFHTHLPYCGHADGDAIDYVREAERLGFGALGFSDHSPVPSYMYGVQGFKMREAEVEVYRQEVLAVKQETSMPIYLGMEVDIISQEYAYLQNTLIPQLQPDYLIGSIHYIRLPDGSYADLGQISNAQRFDLYIEQLHWAINQPEFLFIGHPDRAVCSQYVQKNHDVLVSVWRDLAKLAKEKKKPLEYNTSTPGFLCDALWQAVIEMGTPVVVNSDAHHPSRLDFGLKAGYAWLEEQGANIVYCSDFMR